MERQRSWLTRELKRLGVEGEELQALRIIAELSLIEADEHTREAEYRLASGD